MRCFYFDVPKDLALHNDKMRKLNTHRKHLSKKAGKITIHAFFKQVQIPKVILIFIILIVIFLIRSMKDLHKLK